MKDMVQEGLAFKYDFFDLNYFLEDKPPSRSHMELECPHTDRLQEE